MMWLALGVAAFVAIVVAAFLWSGGSRRGDRQPPYLLALGALADGDRETAFQELKNAVRENSGNVDAYLRLGDLYRERGEAERSLQLHRELTTRSGLPDPTRSRIQMSLARDYLAVDKLEKAAEAGREAVKRAKDPTASLALLREIHERREDPDEAFRTLREQYRREGREKTAASELAVYRAEQANTLLEAGRPDDAERLLKDARKFDAREPRVMFLSGLVREKQGDYVGAVKAWEEILESHPGQVIMLFRSLERVHFLNGTYGDIESTYTRFLERVPGHEDASFGLARFLRRKGQIEAALDTCRSALDQHPKSESLRVLFLGLLVQSGRSQEAENHLNEWVSEILGEEAPKPPETTGLLEPSP